MTGRFAPSGGGGGVRSHHEPPKGAGETSSVPDPGHHGGGAPPETRKPRRPLQREDVTAEYLNGAKPGSGSFTHEPGYPITDPEKNKPHGEIETAKLLHDRLGGTIVLKAAINQQHVATPDYEWRGKLWEHKNPSSEKAANSLIRHGLRQIERNPGGIVLNFGDHDISLPALNEIIQKRMQWRPEESPIDVIVISKGEVIQVQRFKR